MSLYVITEIFETADGKSYATTNNQLKSKKDACNMFETRTAMMLQTPNVEVLNQTYLEEGYGFTKVKFEDGSTLEIGISRLVLI